MKFLGFFLFLSFLLSDYCIAQSPPIVKEGTTVKLSAHVYAIPDERMPMVPNVGIVVGSRATLIVDPGMHITTIGARAAPAGLRRLP